MLAFWVTLNFLIRVKVICVTDASSLNCYLIDRFKQRIMKSGKVKTASTAKAILAVLAGAEGIEVALQPLLRFPKFVFALERRQILTAAPLSPRCICRRQRSPITPGTLRAPQVRFTHTKNSKHRKSDTCCFGRGRRDRTLGTRFWSGC